MGYEALLSPSSYTWVFNCPANHQVILLILPCMHSLSEQTNLSQSGCVSCQILWDSSPSLPKSHLTPPTFRKTKFGPDYTLKKAKSGMRGRNNRRKANFIIYLHCTSARFVLLSAVFTELHCWANQKVHMCQPTLNSLVLWGSYCQCLFKY